MLTGCTQVDPLPCTSVFDFVFSNPNIPPDRVALIDGATGEEVTHAELKSRSRRLASGLVGKLGLKKGDVVTIFSPNSAHYHSMVFAAQCAGLIVCECPTRQPPTLFSPSSPGQPRLMPRTHLRSSHTNSTTQLLPSSSFTRRSSKLLSKAPKKQAGLPTSKSPGSSLPSAEMKSATSRSTGGRVSTSSGKDSRS